MSRTCMSESTLLLVWTLIWLKWYLLGFSAPKFHPMFYRRKRLCNLCLAVVQFLKVEYPPQLVSFLKDTFWIVLYFSLLCKIKKKILLAVTDWLWICKPLPLAFGVLLLSTHSSTPGLCVCLLHSFLPFFSHCIRKGLQIFIYFFPNYHPTLLSEVFLLSCCP